MTNSITIEKNVTQENAQNIAQMRYIVRKCSKHEQTAESAPESHAVFLRPKILRSMAECAANIRPERGICPPSVCGFEHLATFSKEVNSKYQTGAYYA